MKGSLFLVVTSFCLSGVFGNAVVDFIYSVEVNPQVPNLIKVVSSLSILVL